MFTVKEEHLEMLKVALEQFDSIWIHGNGQMFNDKKKVEEKFQASYLHSEFAPNFQKGINPAKYRILFKKSDRIPESVEEMVNLFLKKQGDELLENSKIKDNSKTDYVIMPKKTTNKKNKE